MNTLITITEKYLEYCKSQKRLDYKTITALQIYTLYLQLILKTSSDIYIKISNPKQ